MTVPRKRQGFMEYADGQRGHLGVLGLHSSMLHLPWNAIGLLGGEKKGTIPGLRVLPKLVKMISATENGTKVLEIFPTILLTLT